MHQLTYISCSKLCSLFINYEYLKDEKSAHIQLFCTSILTKFAIIQNNDLTFRGTMLSVQWNANLNGVLRSSLRPR